MLRSLLNGFVALNGAAHQVDAQRIPMLNSDQMDVELSQLTITPDREEQVDFSIPYLVTREGLTMALAHGFRYSDRLHLRLYGAKRGV